MTPEHLLRRILDGPVDPAQTHDWDLHQWAEYTAITAAACNMLVCRRFATPGDVRIHDYLQRLSAVAEFGPFVEAWEAHAVIRSALDDFAALQGIRPDRLTSIHLLMTRTLLHELDYRPEQVDAVVQAAARAVQAVRNGGAVAFEPRRRRRRASTMVARVATSAAAGLIVVAYLVAGFISPGFLIGEAVSQPDHPAEVKAFVERFELVLEAHDRAALEAMLCSTADDVETYIGQLGDVDTVTTTRVHSDGDNHYVLFADITRPGEPPTRWTAFLRREQGSWCLSNLIGH